jgi:hypothetical protein
MCKKGVLAGQTLPTPHETVLQVVWGLEGSPEDVERVLHKMKDEEHQPFLGLDPDGE